MTRTDKIALLENRRMILAGSGKDNASIIRKIDRILRNLKNNA